MKNSINLSEIKEVFIGMDLHKDSWVVSVFGEAGFIVNSVHLTGEYWELSHLLERFAHIPNHKIHIVYEAGCFGFWLCHKLNKEGYDCKITPPTLIPTESGNRIKTDKRDSRKLAQYLAKGILKSIYIPEEEVLLDRELMRTRKQLIEQKGTIERQIKSKLLSYGYGSYQHHGKWSSTWIEMLRTNVAGTGLEYPISTLLNIHENIEEQIKAIELKIKEAAKKEKYEKTVSLLTSAPGIGKIFSIWFLLELGNDFKRFNNSEQYCAYLGLTPSEHSSGNFIHKGRITRASNKYLRMILIEASWVAIKQDHSLLKYFNGLKVKKGGKKAIVAVARRLACRIRQVCLTGQEYQLKAA
jgi:transposase